MDHRLAVPGQVGARLAEAGGAVDVGGQVPGRGRAAHEAAVLGASDGDRRARDVDQHGRPGQGGARARRHRDPHVLADLHVHLQALDVAGAEVQIVAEGRPSEPAEVDGAAHARAEREVALLVELAVVRQIALGRHAEHPAAVHHHRAVVQPVAPPQRRADDEQRRQGGGGPGEGAERLERRVEQPPVEQQIVDGVAGQAQLGEGDDGGAAARHAVPLPGQALRVRGRVGDRHGVRARGDAREALVVERGEVHGPPVVCRWWPPLSPRGGGRRTPRPAPARQLASTRR